MSNVKTWNDFVRHAAYYGSGAIPDEIHQEYAVAIGIPDGKIKVYYARHAVLKMVGVVSSNLLAYYTDVDWDAGAELALGSLRAGMLLNDISGLAFWLAAYQHASGLKLEQEPVTAETGSFWEIEAAWELFIQYLSMIAGKTPDQAQFMTLLSFLYALMEAAGEAPYQYFTRALTVRMLSERPVSEYDM